MPHPMGTHLGIVAALEPEAALVRRNLHGRRQTVHEAGMLWQGRWHDQEVALVRCGMGAQRAASAATWLVQHCPVWGVVSIGFVGALDHRMSTGDAVVVAQVQRMSPHSAGILETAADVIEPDPGLAYAAKLAAAQAALVAYEGTLLSAPAVVAHAAEKQQLGQCSGALAVDMESYSIGCVARAHHLPFLALRTVFDTTKDELSFPAELLTTGDGVLKLGCFAHYMLRHPRLLVGLPQLWYKARMASTNLERWLHHFLTILGQPAFPGVCERS